MKLTFEVDPMSLNSLRARGWLVMHDEWGDEVLAGPTDPELPEPSNDD